MTVKEEPGQITIDQTRYLSTGDVKSDEDSTTWWVPLGLEGKKGTSQVMPIAFTKKVDVVDEVDDSFYKLVSLFLSSLLPRKGAFELLCLKDLQTSSLRLRDIELTLAANMGLEQGKRWFLSS